MKRLNGKFDESLLGYERIKACRVLSEPFLLTVDETLSPLGTA